jgi:hypothetical protein
MRRDGLTPEAIARTVHADRRRLSLTFKERTPEPLRTRIYDRNSAVYGDTLGPSIEHLRTHPKIIESRCGCQIPSARRVWLHPVDDRHHQYS